MIEKDVLELEKVGRLRPGGEVLVRLAINASVIFQSQADKNSTYLQRLVQSLRVLRDNQ
jgi:hypothetical protein